MSVTSRVTLTKMRRSSLSRNHYFVIGLVLGLLLSLYIPQDLWELVQQEECPQQAAEINLIEKFGQEFEPHLNLINKPLAAKKPAVNRALIGQMSVIKYVTNILFMGILKSLWNIFTKHLRLTVPYIAVNIVIVNYLR
uniref:Uncharacterized protein n=1 Tax=Glossina palpalis gambiensis TaxID=67801 RepID=A0A1B0B043_9MUSC